MNVTNPRRTADEQAEEDDRNGEGEEPSVPRGAEDEARHRERDGHCDEEEAPHAAQRDEADNEEHRGVPASQPPKKAKNVTT